MISEAAARGIETAAVKHYGEQAQVDMMIEEMSELTKALLKQRRGYDVLWNILEELADVRIMLEQMEIIYDQWDTETNQTKLDKLKEYKLKRLVERMGKDG